MAKALNEVDIIRSCILPCAKYYCFWFCAMFVAVGQRVRKFWLCAVFEVTGGGVKGTRKPCGANTPIFKKKKISKTEKIENKKFQKKKLKKWKK